MKKKNIKTKKPKQPRKRKEPTQRQSQSNRININIGGTQTQPARQSAPIIHYSSPQYIPQQIQPTNPQPNRNPVKNDEIQSLRNELKEGRKDIATNINGILGRLQKMENMPRNSNNANNSSNSSSDVLYDIGTQTTDFTPPKTTPDISNVFRETLSTPANDPDEFSESEPVYTSGFGSLRKMKNDATPNIRQVAKPPLYLTHSPADHSVHNVRLFSTPKTTPTIFIPPVRAQLQAKEEKERDILNETLSQMNNPVGVVRIAEPKTPVDEALEGLQTEQTKQVSNIQVSDVDDEETETIFKHPVSNKGFISGFQCPSCGQKFKGSTDFETHYEKQHIKPNANNPIKKKEMEDLKGNYIDEREAISKISKTAKAKKANDAREVIGTKDGKKINRSTMPQAKN